MFYLLNSQSSVPLKMAIFIFFILSVFSIPISVSQLTPTETQILFQIRKLLEYPENFQTWNNWTNFCYLPSSPSLKIVCSSDRITELTVASNRTTTKLSKRFSIDSFFTVVTKLSALKVLSLVSLGLWGPLPAKIDRLQSLQMLNLSSNFINGEIPNSVSSMKNLTNLVLADNLLNGTIPDLKNLLFLQELNLGNNSLRSQIPLGLKNLNRIQQLDISNNNFIGSIPSFLFSLPSIQYLSVAENQLTGVLQANISCGKKLTFLDLSHNLFTGKWPACMSSTGSNRTVNANWNCLSGGNLKLQHPYSFCRKEALAVQPPVNSQKKETNVKLGILIGIIGGIIALTVAFGLLIFIICRRSETRRGEHKKIDGSFRAKVSAHSPQKPSIDSRRVPQEMMSAATGLPSYNVFTLQEIEDATNNFDPLYLMGEGSQGQLYKGRLEDGSVVLVKCLKLMQKQNLPYNLTEQMEVISKLRHRHLVSVLGHCIVTHQNHPGMASTIFVVLEHVPNGSLRDYLADWRKEKLNWPQRTAITIGVAKGIQFLHRGVAPGIFGNNLKMENVLLDDSLTAKIGNYNIPLPYKVGSESPPLTDHGGSNNFGSYENAETEDIYQLGIILLQVITGKIITSVQELDELKLQLEKGLTEAATRLRAATDPSMRGTFAYQSVRTAVEITINCLNKDSSMRPTIEDVIWNLQYSIQVQEGWSTSENLGTKM